MTDDLYHFGLSTPSLDIRASLPLSIVIALIINNAPDLAEAEEAILMISVPLLTAGRYDGGGWHIWFSKRPHTLG
jgi:hypothetical protein